MLFCYYNILIVFKAASLCNEKHRYLLLWRPISEESDAP